MRLTRDHRSRVIASWMAGIVAGLIFPSIAQAGFFDFLFPQTAPPAARLYAAPPVRRSFPWGAAPGRRTAHSYTVFGHGPGSRWGDGPYSHRFADHGYTHEHKYAARGKLIPGSKSDHKIGPQGPTDIMDDDSLHRGDAVMTQAGIRIFMGDSGSHHDPEDFLKISEIKKLSNRERSALVALDAPRSAPGGQTSSGHGMVTGRSATEENITVGQIITDPNGRTVRYVGP